MESNKDLNWHFGIAAVGAAFWAYCEWKFVDLRKEIRQQIKEPARILGENDGKPILASGILEAEGEVADEMFNFRKECIKVQRNLMQYDQDWKTCTTSPPEWLAPKVIYSNNELQISPYKISSNLLDSIIPSYSVPLKVLPRTFRDPILAKGFALYSDESSYYLSRYKRKSGQYKPVKGDYKLTYSYLGRSLFFTVVGEQVGDRLVPYKSKHSNETIFLIKPGVHNIDSMLSDVPAPDKTLLYTGRLVGPSAILLSLFLHFKTTPNATSTQS